MAKYHINGKGEPGVCRAQKNCPFGDADHHYSSAEEAREAFERGSQVFSAALTKKVQEGVAEAIDAETERQLTAIDVSNVENADQIVAALSARSASLPERFNFDELSLQQTNDLLETIVSHGYANTEAVHPTLITVNKIQKFIDDNDIDASRDEVIGVLIRRGLAIGTKRSWADEQGNIVEEYSNVTEAYRSDGGPSAWYLQREVKDKLQAIASEERQQEAVAAGKKIADKISSYGEPEKNILLALNKGRGGKGASLTEIRSATGLKLEDIKGKLDQMYSDGTISSYTPRGSKTRLYSVDPFYLFEYMESVGQESEDRWQVDISSLLS